MPGQFTDKNGGLMGGHSDKWSNKNRRPGSHDAGQGSRGSRNQGTGAAGQANTVASQGTDTSNMSKLDKLKYFNSLGLLSPAQKQELDAMEKPAQPEPKAEPKPESKPIMASNPVKELSDKLGKIFAHKPQLLQGIVNELKSVKPEELKNKAQAILAAMQKNSSTEPTEVFSTIMKAIAPEQSQAQPEKSQQPKGNAGGVMSPEEFHKDFDYLGKDFVSSLIKQASYFEDPEKALFHISMATDNADINDDDAVRSSMASAADDLGSFFEPKGDDDIEFDDEEIEQHDVEEPEEEGSLNYLQRVYNRIWSQYGITEYNSYKDFIKNATPQQKSHFTSNLENMSKGSAKPLYDYAMNKLNDFDPENGEDSKFINIADAVYSIVKDGLDVQQSSGTESTEPQQEKQYSPGIKHFIERNKEAIEKPTLEQGLEAFRKPTPEAAKDIHEFLMWLADQMKQNGYSKAQINKNINYYQNEFKDNWWKYKVASNAMTNNAEAYDPDEGTELEHWLLSLESGIEDYDRGNKEDEQNFVNIYNYVHGK